MRKNQSGSEDPGIKALIRAAESGAGEAAQELGDRYREGDGVEQSDERARHWYSVGADLGNADAQNNLGSMLLNGVGCDADAAEAVRWYRASAEQGNPMAQFNLGIRYLHGSGVEQDDRAAAEWIMKSAAQGHVEAIGELGTLFRFGRGVEQNLLRAAQLHLAAAQEGDLPSQGNLADYQGELIELALARNREAAFDLCRMYDWGLGVAVNLSLCWAWVEWARSGCSPMAEGEACIEDLDAEVEKVYGFFRAVLSASERKTGTAMLRALRAEREPSGV